MIQKFKCLKNIEWYRCKGTLVILYVMRRVWSSYFQKLFTDHTVWHGLRRGLMCWCKYQNSLAGGNLYKLHSILESTDGCTKVHIQSVSDVTC
jgi:hypothetical protein